AHGGLPDAVGHGPGIFFAVSAKFRIACLRDDARPSQTNPMSTLAVEFLEPGMVLARDVRGSNGMVLLGAGAELNERHIGIFRSWGIAEVEIKGAAQDTFNTEILTKLDVEQRQ